jgi:hypothetical protein
MRGNYWYVLVSFCTAAQLAGKRKLLSVSILLSTFAAFPESPPSEPLDKQLIALSEVRPKNRKNRSRAALLSFRAVHALTMRFLFAYAGHFIPPTSSVPLQ